MPDPESRPALVPGTLFSADDDELFVLGPAGRSTIRGRGLPELLCRLHPYLSGAVSLGELCARMPEPAGRVTRAALDALASHGHLDWRRPNGLPTAGAGHPAQLPDPRLRGASVLVVVDAAAGPVATDLVDELREFGVGKVTLAPERAPGQQADAAPGDLLAGHDLLLVLGDGHDLDAHLDWESFADGGLPVMHATVIGGSGWIGPLRGAPASLAGLLHRLRASGRTSERPAAAPASDAGPDAEGPPESTRAGLLRALAAHLALAAYRGLADLSEPDPDFWQLHPESGATEPHPLPAAARVPNDQTAPSDDGWLGAVHGRLGPLLGTPDDGIEQVPVAISVAIGTDPGLRLPRIRRAHRAPGYGETIPRAREDATRNAAARTALLAVAGETFLPAIDLAWGSWVRLPRDLVLSQQAQVSEPGEDRWTVAGLAAERGWDQSIDTGLASACRQRRLWQLARAQGAGSGSSDGRDAVGGTGLRLEPEASAGESGRLLALCAAMRLQPALIDVTGSEGMPTVLASDPALPQVCAAALDPRVAIERALLELLALAQLGDHANEAEGVVPGSGGVLWPELRPATLSVRTPVPNRHGRLRSPVSRPEVLQRLTDERVRVYAVPLRVDPVLAAAFPYAVRVILDSPEDDHDA